MDARRVSLPRRIVYALLPLIVLLVLVEVGLRLLGPNAPAQDVSRGFDPSVRYLAPVDEIPGAWRTRLFDDPEREVFVPPRDERVRVLLFGGSNTRLFPEDVLAALLDGDAQAGLAAAEPAALPSTHEVINLGRDGYGSARVSILVEQAVAVLRPDVVLIYSGHNEFIESAFAAELRAQRSAPSGLDRALSRLATFARLRDLLAGPAFPDPTDAPRPEALQRDPAQRPMARAETDAHFARYRDNLRAMARAATRAGARVILCTLAGNMLSPPFVTEGPDGPSPDVARAVQELRARAARLFPDAYLAGFQPPLRLRVPRWYGGRVLDPLAPWTPPPARALTGVLADRRATTGKGTVSVDDAHWPDPSRWNEDVRYLLATQQLLFLRDPSPDERARMTRALPLLDEALLLAPSHGRVLFDRGLVHWLLGDDAAAVADLRAAMVADRTPRCANDTGNTIVREVAAELGLPLVDVDALVRAACPGGLVGYDVLMDVCHLQPGVRVALMRVFADAIRRTP